MDTKIFKSFKRFVSVFTSLSIIATNLFLVVPTAFAASETISCNAGGSRTLTQGTYTDADGTQFTSGADLTLDKGTGGDCTFTFNGTMTLASLTIKTGVTLTHDDNSTAQTNTLTVNASGAIDIQTGALVNVDYLGYDGGAVYATGKGPGAGIGSGGNQGAGGGAHGGNGGTGRDGSNNDDNAGGTAYCSITSPATIGSGGGGGSGSSTGGAGGGYIKLEAGGTLTIDGTVSAAGQNYTAGGYSAGGSGGAIHLAGSSIAGTPDSNISVKGGNGASRGGGGGGGCIYVEYTTSNALTETDYSYIGGSSTGNGEDGGSGQLMVSDTDGDDLFYLRGVSSDIASTPQTVTSLSVDNFIINNNPTYLVESGETLTLSGDDPFGLGDDSGEIIATGDISAASMTKIDGTSLYINSNFTNNANLTVYSGVTFGLEATSNLSTTISSLTNNGTTFVNSGGTFTITDVTNEAGTFRLEAYDVNTPLSLNDLVVNGGTVTHGNNSTAQTHIVNISAANINVGASGSINVDELGYDGGPDYTDGEGPGAGQGAGGFVTVGGGAHGGDGGDGTEVGGTAYCTISDVDTIGSGGGGGSSGGVGGNGGGLIELNVSDTLTVNGTITANGGDGSAGYAGGGAGGGIKINTVTWAGTPAGNIAADGGDGAGDGGGGGGCIQIVYSTSSISSGDLSVAGGSGADNGSVGLTSYSLSNTAPTVSTALATTGQNTDGTGLYNFTFSVDDDDDDTLSVQVECGDSSYADIDIYSAGGGGSSFDNNAATYQITGINTSSGAVDMTLQVATQSTIDDTDTSNFQCRVTPYDGTSTGTASALTGLSLDNLDPSASNDASFSIVSDADSNGIANIGDTIRLNAGTESTGDTVTWSFVSTGVTGEASLTAGTESSAIIAGSFDLAADTPININVADDSGNSVTAQTATSPVLDNQPPSFSSNGTLSLSTDLNSDGIAGIGDKVTLSGATVSSSDSDSFTINLSALTGDSSVSMGSPSTVASGSQSGSQTYTITATDNAGNTATTASDAITVYNFARTVGFSAATSSVSEGGGTATITLSLDSASGANTTINYSVGGTATSGFDYIAPSGSATILAGNTSTTITITIGADTDVEDTETIALSITGATGATASGTTTHTLSIIDDDTESSSSNGGGSSGGNSGGGDSSSDSSSDSSGDSESSDSSSEEASDSDDTDGESSEESEEDSEDEDDEPVEVPAFLDDAEDDEDEDDSPSDFSNDDDLRGSADEDSSDDEESSEEDNVNSDTNTSNLILDIFNFKKDPKTDDPKEKPDEEIACQISYDIANYQNRIKRIENEFKLYKSKYQGERNESIDEVEARYTDIVASLKENNASKSAIDTQKDALSAEIDSIKNEYDQNLATLKSQQEFRLTMIEAEINRLNLGLKSTNAKCSQSYNFNTDINFNTDTDNDGLPDLLESIFGTLGEGDGSGDSDNDGINDADEVLLTFTDPLGDNEEVTAGVTGQELGEDSNGVKSKGDIVVTGKVNEGNSIRCIVEKSPQATSAVKSYSCDEKLLIADNGIYMLEFTPRDGEGDYVFRIEDNYGFVKRFNAEVSTSYIVTRPDLFEFDGLGADSFSYIDENTVMVKEKVSNRPTTILDSTGCVAFGQCIVQARWNSLIFSSVILADSSAGKAVITPPQELEPGEHRVLITTVDTETNEISDTLEINFLVGDVLRGAAEEVKQNLFTMTPTQWALFVTLFVGLTGASSAEFYRRKKGKANS